jgi:hypothetical protein
MLGSVATLAQQVRSVLGLEEFIRLALIDPRQ